jgi:hypothetical protein
VSSSDLEGGTAYRLATRLSDAPTGEHLTERQESI